MKDSESPPLELTPGLLLRAYACGVFPMSHAADDPEVFWVDPQKRGILPLQGFHLSRSLRKRLLKNDYSVRIDTAFDAVVGACAAREETWINAPIRALYAGLHALGHAHSIEVWVQGRLVGGLYGVRLGAAFFGESMFSRMTDGSKIALASLVARLRVGGFTLLDTQFTTPHLESLGARNVPRAHYRGLLDTAIHRRADLMALGEQTRGEDVVRILTENPYRP